LLKIISKLFIRVKRVWSSAKHSRKRTDFGGLFKNPLFFFGLVSIILFGGIYAACADSGNLGRSRIAFFNSFFTANVSGADSFFASQADAIPFESLDFKTMQDNTLCALSTPCVVSGKVLGDAFGGNNKNKKDVTDYVVQSGDNLDSISTAHNISVNTLIWANDLSTSSKVKAGETLTILPVDGVLHIVQSGDTMSAIASKYKANPEDIISYNDLANQDDIYVGDILIIPGGVMPEKPAPTKKPTKNPTKTPTTGTLNNNKIPLANNYFIFPAQGLITQGIHYYNAMDLANKCGTPIYAAASGVIQRAVYNNSWNLGMGNYVTILHPNGVVTYYGHFESVAVKPGDKVSAGDRIGAMGRTGNATGCHVHFQVVGATNPLSRYKVGTNIHY
jgi:murein DD-endopeptidase MepM/ murein hydrolase activator NlpD